MKKTLRAINKMGLDPSATGGPINLAKGSIKASKAILNKTTRSASFDQSLLKKKFTLGGAMLGVAGAGIVSGASGVKELNDEHMGTKSQDVYQATPQAPSYDLNAGATGDLVFDLHSLRRG